MSTAQAHRRVLHLSDTHLTASGFDEDGVDAVRSLTVLLHDLRHLPGLDVVVVSGDVADDGSRAGYSRAVDLIGTFAAERGVPLVFSTGNHDERSAFAAVLGTGHRSACGADVGAGRTGTDERAAVSEVDGLRVITLDSLVPGHVHGHLGEAQLAWLREQLAAPAPAGTLLVLHHPPLAVPGHPMAGVVLDNPGALAAAVGGSDVVAVLAGHLHHQMSGTLAGVAVWVTPGVVTRVDVTAPEDEVRGVLGAGATVVDLGPGGPMFRMLQARDPRAGEQVYRFDMATGADAGPED